MPPKQALWSEDDLIAAVRAVQRGTLSTYKAAERYKILPAQENAPALEHPHAQASESGDTTPSILSEASTPDRDQENIPPINNDEQKSSKSAATTPEQTKQSPAIASTSTGQVSRESIVQRSYYRTVYGTSSSSDESNDLPLSRLKRNDFYDLLPTPVKVQTCTPTVRRKAINYRGTPITKDLFDKYNQKKLNSKEVKGNKRKKNKQDENFTDVKTGRKEKTKFKKALNPKKAKIVSAKKSTTVKDQWKETREGQGLPTIPKNMFPTLLNKLWENIMNNSASNLKAGFKKTEDKVQSDAEDYEVRAPPVVSEDDLESLETTSQSMPSYIIMPQCQILRGKNDHRWTAAKAEQVAEYRLLILYGHQGVPLG
ncbi:unnamed protein product [Arctia plantaginis]|uniref:HTH psq-type domain-containing protein n=1 Tax=Arctia plantaginis TaxID=874455 RepID=A0A8S0Z9T3_ARCPL|nr:unnamed protein product [Arctia plantaginis]